MKQLQINRWVDYEKLAAITDNELSTVKEHLAHYALGLITESSELSSAIEKEDIVNLHEEIGDILWFSSRIMKLFAIDLADDIDGYMGDCSNISSIKNKETLMQNINKYIIDIADAVKAHIAYGREIDKDFLTKKISYTIGTLWNISDYPLSVICQTNIMKLHLRFGGKFDAYLANNRNITSERGLLENSFL